MSSNILIGIVVAFIAIVVLTMTASSDKDKLISEKRANIVTIILGIEAGIALSIVIAISPLGRPAEYTNKRIKAVSDNIEYCVANNYTTEDMVAYVESIDLYTNEPFIASVRVDEESLDNDNKYISFYVITEDGVSVITEPKSREGGTDK